jgi:hypothetical protein
VDRAVNVLRAEPGLVSLAAVLEACPSGLDGRDVAWIWRRLLVALGVAHRAGVIHGAVVPDHVLIEPTEHGLVLTNWCYATTSPGETVPAVVRRYRGWYAPEILRSAPPTPGSDIYLATDCMVALLGDRGPMALDRFARGCRLAPAQARPGDAWQLLAELDDVLGRIYGPRRFRPFALPATVPVWPRQGGKDMGSGRWSTDVYDAAARMRSATGGERVRVQRQRRPAGARRAQPVRSGHAGEPGQRRAPAVAGDRGAVRRDRLHAAGAAGAADQAAGPAGSGAAQGLRGRSAHHVRRGRRRHL